MKKIFPILLVLSLLLMLPVLPSHAESKPNETSSLESSTETQSSEQTNEVEEYNEKQSNLMSGTEDIYEKEEDSDSSEKVEIIEENDSSEDSSSDSSEDSAESEESVIDPQNATIETQTICSFSTASKVVGNVYDKASLTVSETDLPDNSVNLKLDFYGKPTTDEENLYMTYKFPDEIDLSKGNITFAGYQVNTEVTEVEAQDGEKIPIKPPKQIQYSYSNLENKMININYTENTVSLPYKEAEQGLAKALFDGLPATLKDMWEWQREQVKFNRQNETHHFTLEITLENAAFLEEGEQHYTFQAIGTQDENSAFNETNGVQAVTLPLTITETGELTLASVPNLNFQTTRIGEADYVYLDRNQKHEIVIKDTRNFSDDWTLTVRSKAPLSISGSTSLPLRMGMFDADETFTSLEKDVKIADSKGGSDRINLSVFSQRIVVAVDHSHVLSDTYSTTVEWVLTDAVQ